MKAFFFWLPLLTFPLHSLVMAQVPNSPSIKSPTRATADAPAKKSHTEESASSTTRGTLNAAAPPRLGEPINDKAVTRFLENEGEKLARANKTMTSWAKEIGRRSCHLKLPASGKRKVSATEIAERLERSVVIVGVLYRCEKCTELHLARASGFLITESGAMVTSRHTLANFTSDGAGVVALTRDGQLCPVREVLAADPLSDLVVLQLEGANFTPLPVAASALAGNPIFVMSHPESHFYLLTTGIISRYSTQRRRDGAVNFLSITADFAKGSSGAPVVNEFGAAVGVVSNTHSIYFDDDDNGKQDNLQMVIKDCATSQALLDLVTQKAAR
ncbi:MAG: trypsin-like peptidase domain-containing protein [Verrucomicrobia bacterium]|nr:trypsin-like peptidase domain-containing protein [Verrucomicrobiota bacterium]